MLLIGLCALVLVESGRCDGGKNLSAVYKKLHDDLMKDYDRNARPVTHGSYITQVTAFLHFFSAFELDEKAYSINIDSFMSLHWKDQHLSWNSDNYEGIGGIEVSPDEIWTPDIYEVFNGGRNSDLRQSDFNFFAVIKFGLVYWHFASTLPACCEFDYSNYPNDVAKCKIVLQAWSLRGDALDIHVVVRNYENIRRRRGYFPTVANPQWQVTDIVGVRDVWRSKTKNISYPSAQFTLTLRRKTPTLQQQLMWISSIIAVLLTLGMFWIPSDIEQKLTVGCIAMVIVTATLLTVTSTVNTRQAVLIMASKIHNVMYVVTIAILLEIIAINLQHIEQWKPPEFILGIFSGTVGRFLLISSAQQEAPALDKMKLSEYESGDALLEQIVATGNWKTISQAFDRVAFLIFVLIFIILPKSL